LVYRYIENKFRENYKSTLGVNLLKKDMNIEGFGSVSVQIWDLGGQESFKNLRKLYLEGANGAFIIYDMTKRKTFDKLNEWIQSYNDARGEGSLMLIGNKSDLKDNIKVNQEEATQFSAQNNMVDLVITSAKTGDNVEQAFYDLILHILSKK